MNQDTQKNLRCLAYDFKLHRIVKGKRSPYSKDLIKKAIKLVDTFDTPTSKASQILGVSYQCLRRWQKQFGANQTQI